MRNVVSMIKTNKMSSSPDDGEGGGGGGGKSSVKAKTMALFKTGSRDNNRNNFNRRPSSVARSSSSANNNPNIPMEFLQHHRLSVHAGDSLEDHKTNFDLFTQKISTKNSQKDATNENELKPPLPPLNTSASMTSPTSMVELTVSSNQSSTLRRPNSFGRLPSIGSINTNPSFPLNKNASGLTYPRKELRGPYGRMLEGKMKSSNQFNDNVQQLDRSSLQSLPFTDELLKQTKNRRNQLDELSKEAMGTAMPEANQTTTEKTTTNKPTTIEQTTIEHQSATSNITTLGKETPSIKIEVLQNKQVSTDTEDDDIIISRIIIEENDKKTLNTTTNNIVPNKNNEPKEKTFNSTVAVQRNSSQAAPKNNKQEPESITAAIGRHLDTRAHIVGELYDTEKNYCDALKILYESFLIKHSTTINTTTTTLTGSSITVTDTTMILGEAHYLETIAQLMPNVLEIHGKFLEQLRRRIADWSSDQTKISDLFDLFDCPMLIKFYLRMIEHLNDISAILKQESIALLNNNYNNQNSIQSSSANGKNATSANRIKDQSNKRKFTLDTLLISVIQRIPRYELLLKRLINNTDNNHQDFADLEKTLKKIHQILVRIGTNQNVQSQSDSNTTQRADNINEQNSQDVGALMNILDTSSRQLYVRDLETVIEGAQSILEQYRPTSAIHFYDYVMIRKRERSIFVLDTCIILCQIKNKKKSEKFEYNKFKMQQVFNLECVELRCQCWQHRQNSSNTSNLPTTAMISPSNEWYCSASTACRTCIETLENDIRNLLKMQKKAQKIHSGPIRQMIETTLSDQLQMVVRHLAEINEILSRCTKDCNVDMYVLSDSDRENSQYYELMSSSINTQLEKKIRLTHNKCLHHQSNFVTGEPELSIAFMNCKKREDFESIVTNLRAQIVKSRFKLEFMSNIPYQKARAGIQFACALPAIGTNNIWICKSDGFVGQISVLTLENFNEPTVVSCNSVCNARILCLKAVPALGSMTTALNQNVDQQNNLINDQLVLKIGLPPSNFSTNKYKTSFDSHEEKSDGSENECGPRAPENTISSSPSKSSNILQHLKSRSSRNKPQSLPLHSSSFSGSLPQQFSTNDNKFRKNIKESHSNAAATHKSNETNDLKSKNKDFDAQSISSAHSASIAPISPDCPTMWFGTDDSTVYIYSCYDVLRIGKNKAKVTLNSKIESIEYFKNRVFVGLANHMVAIFTKDDQGFWQTTPTMVESVHCYRFCVVNQDFLWTTSLNIIQIRDEELKTVEEPIIVKDIDKISFIVANQNVFVASQNSSYIYRYSTNSPYQLLTSISIGSSVNKALAFSEDIIRHHKNACLKICTLHIVRDRILIGTSAGVVLVLDNKNTLEIVPNGHTGHVRFITSVKLKDGRVMVISGGDGCEQFSPGTSASSTGPSDLFHFMSYCSNLALNLLGRTSSSSNLISSGSFASPIVSPQNNITTTANIGSATLPSNSISTAKTSGNVHSSFNGTDSLENDRTELFNQINRTSNCGDEDSKSYLLIWKVI